MIFNPSDQRAALSLELNLSNRFFGVLESGYSRMRSFKPPNSFEYINRGVYVRTGLEYNLLHRMLRQEAIFLGIAYGQAFFAHEIFYLVNDPYWGIRDLDFNGIPDYPVTIEESGMSIRWAELTMGMKARIWRRFYTGYKFRVQFQLGIRDGERMKATTVPGFNKTNNTTHVGFSYHVWYQLPF